MTKSNDELKIEFPAEIKKVSSKKLASLDVEYQLTLSTADAAVMNLGLIPGDIMVLVKVEPLDE